MPPPWTRDETILALWAARTETANSVPVRNPLVGSLSRLMRSAAPAPALDRRFRNRHGVARKIWKFMDAAGQPESALSAVELAIWREFEGRPVELIDEAATAWSKLATAAVNALAPSRGPPPSPCQTVLRGRGDRAAVYLATLDGTQRSDGKILVKIGRSEDLERREAELNFALPPPLGLRWRMVECWWFRDAMAAHQVEQDILRFEAGTGQSAGREFLLVGANQVRLLIARCGQAARAARRRSKIHPPGPWPTGEGLGERLRWSS